VEAAVGDERAVLLAAGGGGGGGSLARFAAETAHLAPLLDAIFRVAVAAAVLILVAFFDPVRGPRQVGAGLLGHFGDNVVHDAATLMAPTGGIVFVAAGPLGGAALRLLLLAVTTAVPASQRAHCSVERDKEQHVSVWRARARVPTKKLRRERAAGEKHCYVRTT